MIDYMMTAILFAALTIVVYLLMNFIYVRFRRTILTPVLTATFSIVLILLLFDVSYDSYMLGGDWVASFLGPAVVALAVPLYQHRQLLMENLWPISAGILAGVVVGMTSGVLFAKLFGFSEELVLTVLPKSLTTPVAMDVAASLGGIPSLAAVFVMVAGFSGIILGPPFMKWLGIDTPLGRGLGLGASAHGLGTAKAFEYGPQDASMSSVAMTVSAVFGSLLGPVVAWLFFI
ncbi:MAG TPA: LrgB family protein [Planococcus sp. (in: firmicutes)]|nr:LrgB family protein [Planococcus sp. (in: firmicutes)]